MLEVLLKIPSSILMDEVTINILDIPLLLEELPLLIKRLVLLLPEELEDLEEEERISKNEQQ